MRHALVFSAAIAMMLYSASALASPSAKLVYVRGAGAEACPDETELRRAVATRIGYDPFFPVAQKTVIAQVSKAPQGYRAHVQIVAQDGTVRGERDLATKGQDCGELVGATALAISVALDDLDETPGAPPPDPSPPPSPPPSTSEPAPPPAKDEPVAKPAPLQEPSEPEKHTELALLAGFGAVVGTAPSFAGSGQIAGTLSRGVLGLRIDGRADLPSGTGLRPNGRLSTSSFVGTASLCLRGTIPFACAGGGVGWITSTTEGLANPRTDGAVIAVASLRAGARIRASKVFFVEPSITLGANLVQHKVEVDGQTAYELPILWGGASLLAGFDIL